MFRKNILVFGGLAVLIACAASWLAVAQANNWKCEFQAPVPCAPHWASTACPSGNNVCVLTAQSDHFYCYPYGSGPACSGFTCLATCAANGANCDQYH